MAFAKHYTRAEFAAGLGIAPDDRDAQKVHVEEVFLAAFKTHLLELRAEGRLGTTGGVAGRDVWQATEWNDLVVTGRFSRWIAGFVGERLCHWAMVTATPRDDRPVTPEKVDSIWTSLCAVLDEGTTGFRMDLDMFDWRLDTIHDLASGDRCTLVFKDWKAQLMRRINKGVEPAQDIGAIPLAEIEIDCPTGELILADAITASDGAFHDAVDIGARAVTVASVNSTQGAINCSRILAEESGFAQVVTGNTAVAVHRDGDRVLVSERWPDEDLQLEDADGDVTVAGWSKVGAFCCDRWSVVVVDRQVAVAHLEKAGVAMPADVLDAWIADEEDEVVVMKVTPGRYRIHFGPDFSKRFDRMETGVPSGPEPWLLMDRIG